jgi:hypothetical protein
MTRAASVSSRLVLLLQSVYPHSSLSQEEIVRNLEIDAYPGDAKGPQKVRAYQGGETAVRQKFERDKARIRELGFEIETVTKGDGVVGYRIDPSSGYAPLIYFTPDEERVVQMALRFCGFGASGAFSLFNDGPASDGGLESSMYYTPVMRALHLIARSAFDYQSGRTRPDWSNRCHRRLQRGDLPDRSGEGHGRDQGLSLQRMTSMPVVLPDTFEIDEATVDVATAWRPEFSRSPTPMDVVVTTNENYADLLVRQFPGRCPRTRRAARSRSGISFDSPRARCVSRSRRPIGSACSQPQVVQGRTGRVAEGRQPRQGARRSTDALHGPGDQRRAGSDPAALARGLRLRGRAAHQRTGQALLHGSGPRASIMDRLVSFMPMQGHVRLPGARGQGVRRLGQRGPRRFDLPGRGVRLDRGRRELAVDVARPLRVEHRPARGVARLPRPRDPVGDREDRGGHQEPSSRSR